MRLIIEKAIEEMFTATSLAMELWHLPYLLRNETLPIIGTVYSTSKYLIIRELHYIPSVLRVNPHNKKFLLGTHLSTYVVVEFFTLCICCSLWWSISL